MMCVYVCSDQSPAEADLHYLSNATKMELYGVELQDAQVSCLICDSCFHYTPAAVLSTFRFYSLTNVLQFWQQKSLYTVSGKKKRPIAFLL